jgi:hypothetical protein
MPIPDRPTNLDYGYHVYDYPGSAALVAKKTYSQGDIAAWLNATVPAAGGVVGRGAEVAPYREQADAGFWSRKKYRVCRTLGQCNSTVSGYERYSLAKDLERLRVEAANQGLNPALGYAETYFHRKIFVLVFGSTNAAHPQVLLTGGIHGREWISVEIPYLIAEYLIKNYHQDADLTDLLDHAQIWVIPMLNPDGHSWSAVQKRLWRKNRKPYSRADLTAAAPAVYSQVAGSLRITFANGTTKDVARLAFEGVDCNRNFRWGADRERDPTKETFAGPSAGSELETRVLDHCVAGTLTLVPPPVPGPVAALTRLYGSIDYHSAKGAILFHDALDDRLAASEAAARQVIKAALCMQKHIQDYGDRAEYRRGDTDIIVGESSVGSVMDHCYQAMDAAHRPPLALTIELDPVGDAATGRNRWSLSKQRIQQVFEKNLPAALCLIEHARTAHAAPAIAAPVGAGGAVVAPPPCPFRHWPNRIRGRGNRAPAAPAAAAAPA